MERKKGWYIIINPRAGSGRAVQKWKQLKAQLDGKGWKYEVAFTKGRTHARHLTIQAAEKGHRKIIAVGGDGTNNEAINGIVEVRKREKIDLQYALFPAGYGNDFARHFKYPLKPAAWLRALETAEVRRQDLGMVEFQKNGSAIERYFANAAGVGYDAHVIRSIDKGIKGKKPSFLSTAIRELRNFLPQPSLIQSVENEQSGKIYLMIAGICKFAGKGMQLVPHAISNDGLLAITVVKELPKWKIIFNLPKLYTGKIHQLKETEHWQTSSILIEPIEGSSLLLEVDGEWIGSAPCRIVTVPDFLHLLCPTSKKV